MQILHPESKIVILWEALIVVVTLYNSILIPFRIAFNLGASGIWFALDLLTDFILIIDIFLRFRIGYLEQGEMICEQDKIATYYRNKDFKINLISSLPIDLIAHVLLPLTPVYWLGILRIPRLFRLTQCFCIFRKWEQNVDFNPGIIRVGELVLIIFLIDHWVACFWFLIGNLAKVSGESWLTKIELESELVRTQYLKSLYWSITTLTTIGYGDITPTTDLETIFTMIVMFLGVTMYAFIIGNVSALIANFDATQTRFREKLDQVQAYMRERKIPAHLQQNVRNYYQYLWEYHRDVALDLDLLDELPHSLKTQLSLYLYRELLEQVPLFKDAEPCFIEDLVTKLKPRILPPNDYIIREDQIGHEMYFIKRGEVKAFSEKTGKVYRTMSMGSFFGEIALLNSSRRTATVKTLTYCELFVLYKEDFDQVLENYPQFSVKVKEIAEQRYHNQ